MRPVTDPRSAARATRLGDDRRHAVRATGPDDRRHAARATDPADRRLVAKATGPADRKQAARATAHEGVRAPVVKAIGENWIEGAALDVFPEEPLPGDSSLRDLDPDRVMLTPHNVAGSDASRAGNLRLAVEGMVTALRGMVPVTKVNPEVVPRWIERIGPLVK